MTSSFHEDDFDADELDELIFVGRVCYCEVNNHYDWADNVHGYDAIDEDEETISCCDDCLNELPDILVGDASMAGFDAEEISSLIRRRVQETEYSEEVGERLLAAVPDWCQEEPEEGEFSATTGVAPTETARDITFGPILSAAIERALMVADQCLDTRDDYGNDRSWLYQEIVPVAVSAGDNDIEPLLADTPELLAYPIALDELDPVEVVTPGWMIGEAAYQAVAAAAAARLEVQR